MPTSASPIRSNPALWERCKRDAISRMGGKFSARAMQLAVRLYKARGGRYAGGKPSVRTNSLRRWTAEDWGYVGKPLQSRYLPRAVRDKLTPSERRRTNAAKKRSAAQWSRQPSDVAKKASAIRRSLWRGAVAGRKKEGLKGDVVQRRSRTSRSSKKTPTTLAHARSLRSTTGRKPTRAGVVH